METGSARAYGASFAGGPFNLIDLFQRPQTILRLLSWIFSIVVFGCITAEGYINPTVYDLEVKCVFNQNNGACRYSVGLGVVSFLACVVFLLLDACFTRISNAKQRKQIITMDIIFSGGLSFLWFVCFCLLTSQWALTENTKLIPVDAARATIIFSFFSFCTWAVLGILAFKSYREGVDDFTQNFNNQTTNYPYTYPSVSNESFQQSTFATNPTSQLAGSYQPPPY